MPEYAIQMHCCLTAILLSACILEEALAASSTSHSDATCLPSASKDCRQTRPPFRSLLQASSRPLAADLHLEDDLGTRILQDMSSSIAHRGTSRSATRTFPIVWIVVVENMTGFLQTTLACNRALVDKILVVTSPTDQETMRVCQSEGLVCFVTEALHAKGDPFNKGRALREVQQSLHKHPQLTGWMALLMDVDICLPEDIWMDIGDRPEDATIYSVTHRCIYAFPAAVVEGSPTSVERNPGEAIGYFQMYKISPSSPTYSSDYPTAALSDTDFFHQFDKVHFLPSYVHHFDSIGAYTGNWNGSTMNSSIWSGLALPQEHCCPRCAKGVSSHQA